LAQEKHFAVCEKAVKKGEGTFYKHRLIHKKCLSIAKIIWYRL
jgi:hypothetical protein